MKFGRLFSKMLRLAEFPIFKSSLYQSDKFVGKNDFLKESCLTFTGVICDVLRDLLPFAQYKKNEKHP